jgi:hypothetical protein
MSQIFLLLRKSISIYRSHASFIAGYISWLLFPTAGFVLLNFVPNDEVIFFVGPILFLIEILLWLWLSIFIIRSLNDFLDNKKTESSHHQQKAWTLILPTILVGLLQIGLALGGLILLIIPGLLFIVWFAFAKFAVILEGKRGMEALYFSKSLIENRLFKSAAYIFTGPIIILIFYSVLMASIIMVATNSGALTVEMFFTSEVPLWFILLESLIEIFITTPLILIYSLLVYRMWKPLPAVEKRDENIEI